MFFWRTAMKILEIAGENLASFADPFCIQFDQPPFNQTGLFVITGKTGAGKSTLLDAICIALYEETPRFSVKRSFKLGELDINDPKRLLRQGCDHCFARVRFTTDQQHEYEAQWSLYTKKNKLYTKRSFQNLSTHEILDPKTIVEIIGLTFSQFCHSVLLAQGQFAAFLKMPSRERAALLEQMTDTAIYSHISILTYQHWKDEDSKIKILEAQLAQLNTELEGLNTHDLTEHMQELEKTLEHYKEMFTLATNACSWYQQIETCIVAKQTIQEQQQQIYACLTQIENALAISKPALLEKKHHFENTKQNYYATLQEIEIFKTDSAHLQQNTLLLQQARQEYDVFNTQLKQSQTELEIKNASQEQWQQKLTQLTEWFLLNKEIEQFFYQVPHAFMLLNQLVDYEAKLFVLQEKMATFKATIESFPYAKIPLENIILPDEHQRASETLQKHILLNKKIFTDHIEIEKQQQIREHYEQQIATLHESILQIKHDQILCSDSITALKQTLFSESQHSVVLSLREQLNTAQPCPVCGSHAHPFLDQENLSLLEDFSKQWSEKHEKLRHLEEKHNNLIKQLSHDQGSLSILNTTLQTHLIHLKEKTTELEALLLEWSDATKTTWTPDESRENQFNHAMLCCLQQQKETTTYLELIAQHQKISLEWQNIEALYRTAKQEFLTALPSILHYPFMTHPHHIFNTELIAHFKILTEKRTEKEKISTNIQQLHIEINQIQKNYFEIEQARLACKEKGLGLKQQQYELEEKIKKSQLYSQHDLSTYEQTLVNDFNQRGQELDLLEKNYQKNEQEKHHFLGKKQQLEQQYIELEQKEQLLRINPPTISEAQAQEIAQLYPSEIDQLNRKIGALREKQKDFSDKLAGQARLMQNYQRQQEIYFQWTELNKLIGSAEGQKFQQFAQNLTFEKLIDQANFQLNMLTNRYSLQRLDNVENRLEMIIIDHDMMDQKRSVYSLSGGESFLVSLALALGLASLSARRVPIYSLFIDEGFGTLDNEALDLVIHALERLQAHGKQIGVISHISALSERIQTKIHVTTRHHGESFLTTETT